MKQTGLILIRGQTGLTVMNVRFAGNEHQENRYMQSDAFRTVPRTTGHKFHLSVGSCRI